jgi:hypothetical protein
MSLPITNSKKFEKGGEEIISPFSIKSQSSVPEILSFKKSGTVCTGETSFPPPSRAASLSMLL